MPAVSRQKRDVPPPINATQITGARARGGSRVRMVGKRAPPSRERVSAAIAMVRAKQVSSAMQKENNALSRKPAQDENGGASQNSRNRSISSRGTENLSSLETSNNALTSGNPMREASPTRDPLTPKSMALSPRQENAQPLMSPSSPQKLSEAPPSQMEPNTTSPVKPPEMEQEPRSTSPVANASSPTKHRSPHENFFFNIFASRASDPVVSQAAPPMPTLSLSQERPTPRATLSPRSLTGKEGVHQEGQPHLSEEDYRTARVAFSTDSSDEGIVDPCAMADVSRFIDSLNEKGQEGANESDVKRSSSHDDSLASSLQLDPATLASINKVMDAMGDIKKKQTTPQALESSNSSVSSNSSEVSSAAVDPETLAGIAQFIDAVAKAPEKQNSVLRTGSFGSNDNDSIPSETRAGIGAFIDSLQQKTLAPTKVPAREIATTSLYMSSSDESDSIDGRESVEPEIEPETEKELNAYSESLDIRDDRETTEKSVEEINESNQVADELESEEVVQAADGERSEPTPIKEISAGDHVLDNSVEDRHFDQKQTDNVDSIDVIEPTSDTILYEDDPHGTDICEEDFNRDPSNNSTRAQGTVSIEEDQLSSPSPSMLNGECFLRGTFSSATDHSKADQEELNMLTSDSQGTEGSPLDGSFQAAVEQERSEEIISVEDERVKQEQSPEGEEQRLENNNVLASECEVNEDATASVAAPREPEETKPSEFESSLQDGISMVGNFNSGSLDHVKDDGVTKPEEVDEVELGHFSAEKEETTNGLSVVATENGSSDGINREGGISDIVESCAVVTESPLHDRMSMIVDQYEGSALSTADEHTSIAPQLDGADKATELRASDVTEAPLDDKDVFKSDSVDREEVSAPAAADDGAPLTSQLDESALEVNEMKLSNVIEEGIEVSFEGDGINTSDSAGVDDEVIDSLSSVKDSVVPAARKERDDSQVVSAEGLVEDEVFKSESADDEEESPLPIADSYTTVASQDGVADEAKEVQSLMLDTATFNDDVFKSDSIEESIVDNDEGNIEVFVAKVLGREERSEREKLMFFVNEGDKPSEDGTQDRRAKLLEHTRHHGVPLSIMNEVANELVISPRNQTASPRAGAMTGFLDIPGMSPSARSSASDASGSEIMLKHMRSDFDKIEGVDESEAIAAFFERKTALEAAEVVSSDEEKDTEDVLSPVGVDPVGTSSDDDVIDTEESHEDEKESVIEAYDDTMLSRPETSDEVANEQTPSTLDRVESPDDIMIFRSDSTKSDGIVDWRAGESIDSQDGVAEEAKEVHSLVLDAVTEDPEDFEDENELIELFMRGSTIGENESKVFSPTNVSEALASVDEENDNDFTEMTKNIEDVDESENISAFLSRMAALKAGGHLPNVNLDAIGHLVEATSDDNEAVEVDAIVGFVNKGLAPSISSEIDQSWWGESAVQGKSVTSKNVSGNAKPIAGNDDLAQKYPSSTKRLEQEGKISPEESRIVQEGEDWDPPAVGLHVLDDSSTAQIAEAKSYKSSASKSLTSKNSEGTFSPKKSKQLGHSPTALVPRKPLTASSKFENFFLQGEARMMKKIALSWQSPWDRRWVRESDNEEEARGSPVNTTITGVSAAHDLANWRPGYGRRRRLPIPKHWQTTYKARTQGHSGYFDIDVHSLYDTSVVVGDMHLHDADPWEHRDVKQRFLQEQSISFSRNWFGSLTRVRGNDKYREPVARPTSMEMPMDSIPDQDWSEDWYTTWQARRERPRKHDDDASSIASSECDDGTYYSESIYTEGSSYTGRYIDQAPGATHSDVFDESWDDPPECGTFSNVRQKIGERVSRVHPDHVSVLRHSRWRRRYFPRGTFPYKG